MRANKFSCSGPTTLSNYKRFIFISLILILVGTEGLRGNFPRRSTATAWELKRGFVLLAAFSAPVLNENCLLNYFREAGNFAIKNYSTLVKEDIS